MVNEFKAKTEAYLVFDEGLPAIEDRKSFREAQLCHDHCCGDLDRHVLDVVSIQLRCNTINYSKLMKKLNNIYLVFKPAR